MNRVKGLMDGWMNTWRGGWTGYPIMNINNSEHTLVQFFKYDCTWVVWGMISVWVAHIDNFNVYFIST